MVEERAGRYELLDAIRGIAILMVIGLHFGERGVGSGDQLIHSRVWPVLHHGYLGVQLFFVISGYCIAAAVQNSFERNLSGVDFLKRRFRRIFPPYWASMIFVVLLGFLTITVLHTDVSTVFPLQPWEWLANVFLLQGPLQAQDANLVYWSLSIELQFYFLMAVGVVVKEKSFLWITVLSLAVPMLSWIDCLPGNGWVFTYWAEFLSGIAAWYWLRHEKIRGSILLLICLAIITLNFQLEPGWLRPDGGLTRAPRQLVCFLLSIVIISLAPISHWLVARRLTNGLQWLGLISYSLYLTHVPIGTRVFNLGFRLFGNNGVTWLWLFFLALFSSLLLGWIFHRKFEKPWLQSLHKSRQEPMPSDSNIASVMKR
jgi:exopolysaccharide production protein ExoZ